MVQTKALSLFFLATSFGFLSACVPKIDSIKNQPNSIQKTPIDLALQAFDIRQTFWSSVRKTLFQNDRFYSLVFSKESPTGKIQSELVVHSKQGEDLPFSQLSPEFTLIDFDISPSGQIVQLGYAEVENSANDTGHPYKELSVFINSKKSFVFSDSKQNLAITYDQNGNSSPARHYDANKTLFLTSSPMTAFAKLRVNDEKIFISATGSFGFKLFCFNYTGQELAQTEILPQSTYNTVIIDKESPFIDLLQDQKIITGITTSGEDAPIFKKHFGISLDWNGPKYQVILQTFDFSLSRKDAHLLKSSGDFFLSGLKADRKQAAAFGFSGGAGSRNAVAAVFSPDFSELYRAEFTLTKESSLSAAVFSQNHLLVGGSTGFVQAQTGSVVEPADSFISAIGPTGAVTTLNKFGTNRHDSISSLLKIGKDIYVSGQQDGPITHTADEDPNQGYQKWFLGKIK